jgi:hypothetical protein
VGREEKEGDRGWEDMEGQSQRVRSEAGEGDVRRQTSEVADRRRVLAERPAGAAEGGWSNRVASQVVALGVSKQ